MVPIVLKDFAFRIEHEQFVLFAGAGISIGSPASLPNWFKLNEWILEALYHRVSREFGLNDDYSQILLEYRNASQSYPPDYQAQFLEECAGAQYFKALTSLDIAYTNICHNTIAALAKSGRVAAIVTTNFDRLIEQALDRVAVPFLVACDPQSFSRLNDEWQQEKPNYLPVIKIHGSIELLDSLIDTRKQRRRGRAKALTSILTRLLHQHPFVFAGFSGADFEHDRRYLGIWDAAGVSPGLCYLYQPGCPPKPVIVDLMEHYGENAKLIEIDAAQALEYLADSCGVLLEEPISEDVPVPTQTLVQNRINTWAESLDPWQAVRMTAALQEAASLRVNALRILKCAVRPKPDDAHEYFLMLADWVKARLRRAQYDDPEMHKAIQQLVNVGHPLGPYYQELSGAFCNRAIAGPDHYLLRCIKFAQEYDSILAGFSPTMAVDAVLLISWVSSLYEELPELLSALQFARVIAEADGDDVRLANIQAEIAIRLALIGKFDEAQSLIYAALEVANEFRERRIASTAMYAHALIQEHQQDYGAAIGSGEIAYRSAVADELRLCMSRALLLQLRVACRHGGPSNVDEIRRIIEPTTENTYFHGRHKFWAHDLERQLYEAEFAIRCHDIRALEYLNEVASSARSAGMEWILKKVEILQSIQD